MKFVKGHPKSSPTYYLVDWQIIAAAHRNEVWGIIIDKMQAEINARSNRILELKDGVIIDTPILKIVGFRKRLVSCITSNGLKIRKSAEK